MVSSLHAFIVRHISRMWKLAELRYEDPALFLKDPSRFLSPASGRPLDPVLWTGQVNEGENFRKLLSSASNIHITLKSDNSLDNGKGSYKILTVDGLQVRLFHKGYSYFQAFGQNCSVQIGTIIGIRQRSRKSCCRSLIDIWK